MRPQTLLASLAATASLTAASIVIPAIPEEFGVFSIESFDNGTTVATSLSSPDLPPVITQNEAKRSVDAGLLTRSAKFGKDARSAELEKRRTDCWGRTLDQEGVDVATNHLANYVGGGHEVRTPGNGQVMVGAYHKAVVVYYCVSRPNSVGNADRNDVWHGHNQMNAACGQYRAGWYGWPGSVEILGRAWEGAEICLAGGPW